MIASRRLIDDRVSFHRVIAAGGESVRIERGKIYLNDELSVSPIEEVEDLEPELEGGAFAQGRRLEYGKVHCAEAGPGDGVPAKIAEGPARRKLERRGIEVGPHCRIRRLYDSGKRIANKVYAIRPVEAVAHIRSGANIEREPGMRSDEAVELPAPSQSLRQGAPRGQFIRHTCDKDVARVEIRAPSTIPESPPKRRCHTL